MVWYSSTTRDRLIAQIETIDVAIAAAEAAFLVATGTEIKKYRFDSAEASQQAEFRDLDEILDTIDKLEARRAALVRRLNGMGVVNMNMRRKNYNDFRFR